MPRRNKNANPVKPIEINVANIWQRMERVEARASSKRSGRAVVRALGEHRG